MSYWDLTTAASGEQKRLCEPDLNEVFVVPNVFPELDGSQGELDKLHDVFTGHIPNPEQFADADDPTGWLRFAVEAPGTRATYIRNVTSHLQDHYKYGSRASRVGQVTVSRVDVIERTAIPKSALTRGVILGHQFGANYMSVASDYKEKCRRVERAIAYSGKIVIEGEDEQPALGMHFTSGRIKGWVKIG